MAENLDARKMPSEADNDWGDMEHPEELEPTGVEEIEDLGNAEDSENSEETDSDEARNQKIGASVLDTEQLPQNPAKTGSTILEAFDKNFDDYRGYIMDRHGDDSMFRKLFAPHLTRLKGIVESTMKEVGGDEANPEDISAAEILERLRTKRIEYAKQSLALRARIDELKISGDKAALRQALAERKALAKIIIDQDRAYHMASSYASDRDISKGRAGNGADIYERLIEITADEGAMWADGRQKDSIGESRAVRAIEKEDIIIQIMLEKAGEGGDFSQVSIEDIEEALDQRGTEINRSYRENADKLQEHSYSLSFIEEYFGEKARELKRLRNKDILLFDKHLQNNRIRELLATIIRGE